jgi:hypothetical protein
LKACRQGKHHHLVAGRYLQIATGNVAVVVADNAPDNGLVGKLQLLDGFFGDGAPSLARNSNTSASMPVRHLVEITSAVIVKRMI